MVAQAKATAMRALELDEHLAAAHAALASILVGHYWDWVGAGPHFRRALELDPNDPDLQLQYCLYLRTMGRQAESPGRMRPCAGAQPLRLAVEHGALLGLLQRASV
jgi:Tfp pilus assembly protein PilF